MLRFVSLLLLLISSAMGAKYDGVFKLSEGVDEHSNDVSLPANNRFSLMIRSEDDAHYALSIRLGNSLRGQMTVSENGGQLQSSHDGVQLGSIVSTRMMPPENIFRVEQFLISNLPKTTDIYFEDNDEKLVLEGAAKIVFSRE